MQMGFFGQYFENGQRWASKELPAPLPSAVFDFWFLEMFLGKSTLQLSGTGGAGTGMCQESEEHFFPSGWLAMGGLDALWRRSNRTEKPREAV